MIITKNLPTFVQMEKAVHEYMLCAKSCIAEWYVSGDEDRGDFELPLWATYDFTQGIGNKVNDIQKWFETAETLCLQHVVLSCRVIELSLKDEWEDPLYYSLIRDLGDIRAKAERNNIPMDLITESVRFVLTYNPENFKLFQR